MRLKLRWSARAAVMSSSKFSPALDLRAAERQSIISTRSALGAHTSAKKRSCGMNRGSSEIGPCVVATPSSSSPKSSSLRRGGPSRRRRRVHWMIPLRGFQQTSRHQLQPSSQHPSCVCTTSLLQRGRRSLLLWQRQQPQCRHLHRHPLVRHRRDRCLVLARSRHFDRRPRARHSHLRVRPHSDRRDPLHRVRMQLPHLRPRLKLLLRKIFGKR